MIRHRGKQSDSSTFTSPPEGMMIVVLHTGHSTFMRMRSRTLNVACLVNGQSRVRAAISVPSACA